MAIIGIYEYESFQLEVEVRRSKQILENIQALENQNKKPNLEQIEAKVEDELKSWNQKLAELAQEIENGKNRLDNLLPEENSAELKKLYRELARKLHPDINKDFYEQHKTLWSRIQVAYQYGNIDELKVIKLIVDDMPNDISMPNALEQLRERKDNFKQCIKVLIDDIYTIKSGEEFTLLENLEDSGWVEEQINKCKKNIAHFKKRKDDLDATLKEWRKQNGQ
jgi:PHD/YefM family antitoxin component YafN of YafNO toxin-antitoxin module